MVQVFVFACTLTLLLMTLFIRNSVEVEQIYAVPATRAFLAAGSSLESLDGEASLDGMCYIPSAFVITLISECVAKTYLLE